MHACIGVTHGVRKDIRLEKAKNRKQKSRIAFFDQIRGPRVASAGQWGLPRIWQPARSPDGVFRERPENRDGRGERNAAHAIRK